MPKHSIRWFALAAFVIALLINLFVRAGAIWSEVLVADDLIYLPLATIGECIIPRRHPIDFYFLCYAFGTDSVVTGRLLFVFYLAAIASILYSALRAFGMRTHTALMAAVACFGGVPVLSQVTFVTGSYPTHGLFFLMTALWLSSVATKQRSLNATPVWVYLAILFLLALTGIAATSMTLASATFFPFALYALATRQYRSAGLWLLVSVGPAVTFVVLQYAGVFSNHYASLTGWVRTDPEQMFMQVLRHLALATKSLGVVNLTITVPAALAAAYVYATRQIAILRSRTAGEPVTDRRLLLMGVALAGLLACTLPTLLVQGSTPRYLTAPLTFLLITTFTSLDYAAANLIHRRMVIAVTPLAVIVCVLSVVQLHRSHSKTYSKLIADQRTIVEALRARRDDFAQNAQILLMIEESLVNASSGFNHWSTHLARFALERTDITAVIGKRSQMVHDPFTGVYADHGPQFWGEKDGRRFRKSMVGLDKSRPITVLSLAENKTVLMNCITVAKGGTELHYRANHDGIHELSGKTSDLTCARYRIAGKLSPVTQPAGKLLSFDGSSQKTVPSPEEAFGQGYEIDLYLRSSQNATNEYGFTRTSPPMPVFAPPLVIYQTSASSYNVALKCASDVVYGFEEVSRWSRITLRVDAEENAELRVNETHVADASKCDVPKELRLGRGYLDRYWTGDIGGLSFTYPRVPSPNSAEDE